MDDLHKYPAGVQDQVAPKFYPPLHVLAIGDIIAPPSDSEFDVEFLEKKGKSNTREERNVVKFMSDYLNSNRIAYARVSPVKLFKKPNGEIGFGKIPPLFKGCADFLFSYNGVPVAIEAKDKKGSAEDDQKLWRKRWETQQGFYAIVKTPEQFLNVLKDLKTRGNKNEQQKKE